MSVLRRFAGPSLILGLTTIAGCGMDAPDVTTSSTVVEPVNFVDPVGSPIDGNLERAAVDFVKETTSMTGADRTDWKVRSVKRGQDGRNHVRLDQVYAGIKVWGADVVVHADDASFRGLDGVVAKQIDENLAITPKLTGAEALAVAKGGYDAGVPDRAAQLAYSRESAELVIYPDSKSTVRLAWHTAFYTELQAGQKPGLWNNIIAADTGEVLFSWNAIHTLSQASGPGGNPKVPRTWVDALDVEPATAEGMFQMNTARLITEHMNGAVDPSSPTAPRARGTVVVGPLANIGDAALNDAHGFAELTLNMLTEWIGRSSIDDQGEIIISRVHYGTNYENAFWNGEMMTYGDGASTFYPLSGALDVVAHEIHHGFTERHSGLLYWNEPGGLNEGFSDIAGTVAEFFGEGAAADFDMGEDVFRAQNEALRYMCTPSQDGISIEHASEMTTDLDPHFSSGVPNKAFCRAVRRASSGGNPDGAATVDGVRRIATAFFEANASYWTAGTSFKSACLGTLNAARELGFSETEIGYIQASWADVGVEDCEVSPACTETLTAETGTVTSGAYANNVNRTWCIRPASGRPVTVTFTAFNTERDWDYVTVFNGTTAAEIASYHGLAPTEIPMPAPATAETITIRLVSDGSVTRSGFTATWSTTGEPPPNQAPTVAITAPANNAEVFDTITVTANATDVDGTVTGVVFTLPDGTSVTDSTAPYSTTWVTSTVANGVYPITAVATDDDGASTTATINVNVNNIDCTEGVFSATDVPQNIPDNNPTGITSVLPIVGAGVVQTLSLSLNIQHTYQGDLVVELVSPAGAVYRIHSRTGGTTDNLIITDRAIGAAAGQTIAGNWTLRVSDRARVDRGALTAWSLNVVGRCR